MKVPTRNQTALLQLVQRIVHQLEFYLSVPPRSRRVNSRPESNVTDMVTGARFDRIAWRFAVGGACRLRLEKVVIVGKLVLMSGLFFAVMACDDQTRLSERGRSPSASVKVENILKPRPVDPCVPAQCLVKAGYSVTRESVLASTIVPEGALSVSLVHINSPSGDAEVSLWAAEFRGVKEATRKAKGMPPTSESANQAKRLQMGHYVIELVLIDGDAGVLTDVERALITLSGYRQEP